MMMYSMIDKVINIEVKIELESSGLSVYRCLDSPSCNFHIINANYGFILTVWLPLSLLDGSNDSARSSASGYFAFYFFRPCSDGASCS